MEVDCPGTVHFPDGVFQDCRAVTLGYATMLQKRRFARRQANTTRDDPDVAVIGDNAFGNYFASSGASSSASSSRRGTRYQQVAPEPAGDEDALSVVSTATAAEDASLTPMERRRRRREQREQDMRARRVSAATTGDADAAPASARSHR